nr:retrovirus-related Pol polyprotein from transposon TNT 1-94 [Tanacetum cinerariifolium]
MHGHDQTKRNVLQMFHVIVNNCHKKGKQIVGESSTPKKSLKFRIKQRQHDPSAPIPMVFDIERDQLIEATQLSLAEAKTAKEYKAQQNVAIFESSILAEDFEKIVEGEDVSDDNVFGDSMILSKEDFGQMMQHMKRTFIHKNNVRTILKKADNTLKKFVPKMVTMTTDGSMKDNLLWLVVDANTILNVYPTLSASTALITNLQHQLYMKMKSVPQSQVVDSDLLNALRAKYEKSSTSTNSCRHDAFRKRDHDDHPDDDGLPEGEKSAKRKKTSKRSKNAEEYAYHLEQAKNYMENHIVWKSSQEDLKIPGKEALVFNEEKKYVLSLHKIHATSFPESDLEEKLTQWVQKEFKTFNKEAQLSISHSRDTWHKRFYIIKERKERDFQDSPNDEEDTRSSQEYMNDLEEEYQESTLLAKSKRFFKDGTQRISSAKETDQTECHKCEEVSSDDNEVTEVIALMALADEEKVSVGKESSRNDEWFKISMKKVNTLLEMEDNDDRKSFLDYLCIDLNYVEEQRNNFMLSEAKNSTLSNHDTCKISSVESQRNTIDPSVAIIESSTTNYDSADESSIYSTPLPPLKKLDGAEPISRPKIIKSILKSKSTFKVETLKGIIINEPSSAPTRGNKSSSAPAGKLKNVKREDDL